MIAIFSGVHQKREHAAVGVKSCRALPYKSVCIFVVRTPCYIIAKPPVADAAIVSFHRQFSVYYNQLSKGVLKTRFININ